MNDPTNNPSEPWQIRHAREALAKSKAADSNPQNACQHWGRLEAVLEALLDHLDRQAARS